jgi:hypothetical protein
VECLDVGCLQEEKLDEGERSAVRVIRPAGKEVEVTIRRDAGKVPDKMYRQRERSSVVNLDVLYQIGQVRPFRSQLRYNSQQVDGPSESNYLRVTVSRSEGSVLPLSSGHWWKMK